MTEAPIFDRMINDLPNEMRSKKSLRHREPTTFTKEISRIDALYEDSKQIFYRSYVRTMANSLSIHYRVRVYIDDGDTSLHMMGLSLLPAVKKRERYERQAKYSIFRPSLS